MVVIWSSRFILLLAPSDNGCVRFGSAAHEEFLIVTKTVFS